MEEGREGGGGFDSEKSSERWNLEEMNRNVLHHLKESWPKYKNSSMLDTWKIRDDLMRNTGPACVVVGRETLERLGRIPRYDEGESI